MYAGRAMSEAATLPPRRVSTDDRRAEIAAAARALIVEKGVEGLRTRDIAERVGINVATLHYHVPSKDALIELVAASLIQDFRNQHVARPREHLSAREQLDLEFVDFRELAEDRPEVMLVFSELIERARRDERIAATIMPLRRSWRQAIVELLGAGKRDGDYRADLDPEAFAGILISALVGFCRTRMREPGAYDRLVAELQRAIRNPDSAHKD